MAFLVLILFVGLLAVWVWAEYKVDTAATRLALGAAVVLMLCAALYSSQLRNFYHDSHNAAAIRMLGEALDDGDVEAARDAIHDYNSQDSQPTGYAIVSFLSERKRTTND